MGKERLFVWAGVGLMESGDWFDIVVETDLHTGAIIFQKSVGRAATGASEILDVMTELVNQLQGHFKTAACRAQMTPVAPVMPRGGAKTDLPGDWDGEDGCAELCTVDGGALKLMVAGRRRLIRQRKPQSIAPGMLIPSDIKENGAVLVRGGHVLSPRLVRHLQSLGSANSDRTYTVCTPSPLVRWALDQDVKAAA